MSNTSNSGDRGRFSARRKTDAVLRLLRGEDLELLSRELVQSQARFCESGSRRSQP